MDLKEWAKYQKIKEATPIYTTPKGMKFDGEEFIYVLIDPRNNEIRYVGKTIRPLNRLAQHMRSSKNPFMKKWVAELKKEGLSPLCKFVERTSCLLNEREQFYIAFYLAQGADLLNMQCSKRLVER